MLKTIKLSEEKELRLDSNLRWAVIFQAQTGEDILPSLLPVLYAGADLMTEAAKISKGGKDAATIMETLDKDNIKDAIVDLAGLRFNDALTLIWSMARNAGETRDLEEWLAWADPFPTDIIFPVVFELLVKTLVSGKNAERILTPLGKTDPESQRTES